MGFVGIGRPEEFRTVTRSHVLAWRKDLEVGVGERDAITWMSVSVFEKKARALAGLARAMSCTSKAAYWIRACGGTGAV